MANIKKIEGKTGAAYKITVTTGRDSTGKQIRHFKTWRPDRPMTARQVEKEVQRVAVEFEKEIEQGYQTDNRQTFHDYRPRSASRMSCCGGEGPRKRTAPALTGCRPVFLMLCAKCAPTCRIQFFNCAEK